MTNLLTLLLGVGLLTGGLMVMRHGLKRLLWRRLYNLLCTATLTPVRGLLAGILASVLFQSSTAVCLLTIGLVTAEYLTFRRSVGIILGANIGTCSTVGLLGFVSTEMLLPVLLIIAAAFLTLKRTRTIGVALLGLACMFCGLYLLNRGVAVFQEFTYIQGLIVSAKESCWHGITAGVLITFLFQSSSAATAMLMSMAEANIFGLTSAAYIVYGANLGSCLSSVLVSVFAPLAAKRVAAAHVLLNLMGIIIFLPATDQLIFLVRQFSAEPDIQVAAMHTIFNALSSLAILPATGPFSRLIELLIPQGRTFWR